MIVIKVISIIIKKPHKHAQKNVHTLTEPHMLLLYDLCSKTAGALGSDPEIPKIYLEKIYCIPHQCRPVTHR